MTVASEIVTTTSLLDWVDLRHLHALTGQAESNFAAVIVKESIDNGIDAAERAGVAPRVGVAIYSDESGWHIEVGDNGGGISADELVRISDFHTRASSKDWRRATTRGQQGNAWKTVLGIVAAYARRDNPHATLCQAVEVASGDRCWTVNVRVDSDVHAEVGEKGEFGGSLGKPRIDQFPDFSPSTVIRCRLPGDVEVDGDTLRRLVRAYGDVNPHLELFVCLEDQPEHITPSKDTWRPQTKTSAHWYTAPDFARYATAARQLGWTVSKLVGSFEGLSSKESTRAVLEQARIAPGTRVDELDHGAQGRLYGVLQECAPETEPRMLAAIGRAHLARVENTKYASVDGTWEVDGTTVPFVVEAALIESNEYQGEIVTAINNSPTYAPPFPDERFHWSDDGWFTGFGINAYLASFHLDGEAPFRLVLHIACPRLDFKDRGKSAVESTPELRDAVAQAIWRVARGFYKREEKHRREHARRRSVRVVKPEPETKFTDVRHLVIPAAYRAAAGSYPWAMGRQVMYKARDLYQRHGVERELKDSYFLQTLLPDFQRDNPERTADWNVYHDARRHLWEPHGGKVIPLGTEDLEEYLRLKRDRCQASERPYRWDTEGPGDRYGTLLFIEKEGFRALLEDSGILNQFDVGLMSTKGMSTTDSRKLLQRVSPKVKILALHDFDVAGMSIVCTLSRDTKRFQFSGPPPEIIDIGVRWDDIQQHRLPSERVTLQYDPTERLIKNGATAEEIEFLASGRRVELNAFGNDEFVSWVRGKLEHHARKVIPDQQTLEAAYVEAQRERRRRDLLVEVERQVAEMVVAAPPANLRVQLASALKADPSQCWDDAVWSAAGNQGNGKKRRG